MTVKGVSSAETREIRRMDYDDLSDILDAAAVGLKGSPTQVVRTYTKEPKAQGAILKGLTPDEAVDAIMARLHEEHLI